MTSDRPQTTLGDFRKILAYRNSEGEQLVVVGGQAVNFWGEYYFKAEPGIALFLPLTSGDLDLLGSVDDLAAIAKVLNSAYGSPEPGTATPVIGIVNFTTVDGVKTRIEILLSLYGLSAAELKAGVVETLNSALGLRLRVLNPVACLKSKASNVVGLDQSRRQDSKHLKILMLCNRAFLRDVLVQAGNKTISERAAVNSFEAVFKFVQSRTAAAAAQKLNLDWSEVFPTRELKRTELKSLQKFYTHRLQKAFPSCAPD